MSVEDDAGSHPGTAASQCLAVLDGEAGSRAPWTTSAGHATSPKPPLRGPSNSIAKWFVMRGGEVAGPRHVERAPATGRAPRRRAVTCRGRRARSPSTCSTTASVSSRSGASSSVAGRELRCRGGEPVLAGRRAHEGHRGDPVGVVDREEEGGAARHRPADDVGPLDAEGVEDADGVGGQVAHRVAGVAEREGASTGRCRAGRSG